MPNSLLHSRPLVLRMLAILSLSCLDASFSYAQIQEAEQAPSAARLGEPRTARYRVGMRIEARSGTVQKIRAMVTVPLPCDLQQSEIVEEDISDQIDKVIYRDLPGGGARQLLIHINRLPSGETAHAIVTFEVRTHSILPPLETELLVIPKRPGRGLRPYLGESPYIEVRHRKIRTAVKEALARLQPNESPVDSENGDGAESGERREDASIDNDSKDRPAEETAGEGRGDSPPSPTGGPTDWQRVEALYDYARDTVEYLEGPDKSAVRALKDRKGDCQAISALFVAMCRTAKIPARIVWVHDHNYPEFYLEDAEGNGHWYPCESSGLRAFGQMPTIRTILQRGDNFRVPERPRERLRYASDYLIGLPTPGGGKPSVKYIREQL